jgi:hypothetical protein
VTPEEALEAASQIHAECASDGDGQAGGKSKYGLALRRVGLGHYLDREADLNRSLGGDLLGRYLDDLFG